MVPRQLAHKPLTAHDWHKLVLMLQTIRPYDADGDVHHGIAFQARAGGDEHVGVVRDGVLTILSSDHPPVPLLAFDSDGARMEIEFGGERVEVGFRATLLSGVKAVAWTLARAYVRESKRMCEDALARASDASRARVRAIPHSFGAVRGDLPQSFLPLVRELVPARAMRTADSSGVAFAEKLDTELGVLAMHCPAGRVDRFAARLSALFPHTRIVSDVEQMTEAEAVVIMIAPVKGVARVREKVREAARNSGGDQSKWPFVQTVGDFLRASIICQNFDELDRVDTGRARLRRARGHGRLKVSARARGARARAGSGSGERAGERARLEMMCAAFRRLRAEQHSTDAERPPDMLINVVMDDEPSRRP